MLSGPFDSAYGFVSHVALQNCVDYFRAVERRKEAKLDTFAAHVDEVRLLFNAAVSLNHALEWQVKELGEKGDGATFRKEAEMKCPALCDVRNFANAAKHRFRDNPKGGVYPRKTNRPHARDTIDKSMEGSIQIEDEGIQTRISFSFDISRFHDALSEGFGFWVDWQNAER